MRIKEKGGKKGKENIQNDLQNIKHEITKHID